MRSVKIGARVKLKPARADAYGLDRAERYEVVRTYTRPGYVAVWCELAGGSMVPPVNRVKSSELERA